MHELFEQQAAVRPDAVALVFGEEQLTYGELNARANQLAHHLMAQGMTVAQSVGVCLPRSVEMVVSVLAILKAGGAYVPLDPSLPPQRLGYMTEDANLHVVLSNQNCIGVLAGFSGTKLLLDEEKLVSHVASYDSQNPVNSLKASDLAYVIYTSGSTGLPKGVLVEHQGVVNYLCHAQSYWEEEHKGAVMSSPLSFDATVTTLFTPLISGKTLVVLPEDITQTFKQLVWYLFEQGESWLFKLTPAHLDGLYPL
ncbi:AMP-binding protein, partial [Alteromonas sp. ASW11-130]|uniref:AMP-binding protein n=1 Tax=Alteromonas sp. ASW11-130 TaxID=3015775 RepID=UPI002241F130|nr:AMP-binding protein [Alteromonas sp. ASW11-130]